MKYHSRIFLVMIMFAAFFACSTAEAYYVWSPAEGKFISPENQTQKTAEEQYGDALRLREEGKTDQMIRQLRELVRAFPLSAHAPEAQYLIATTVEEQGNQARAASEFQKLIHDFPQSNQVDQAVERLYSIGMVFLEGRKQKVLGVPILPTLPKAIETFQFIVDNAPYGAYGDQAQFQLGAAHRKMGHYGEAVGAFQKLIDDYPNSALSDDAHYQLAEASFELSQNTTSDQQSLSSASDHLKQFIQQYRTSSLAQRAEALKRQLDEQDAEKNYRIGLYYEKEGFIESALIYYEDVANRYVGTPFGQKAAERYQALAEPARAVSQDKTVIEKRLAEVDSLLIAIKQEEAKKDLSVERISEVGAMRTQLESERASLALAEKQFEKETKTKFSDRAKALRQREKNLREKFKTFGKRKKAFGNQPSPELIEVLEQWNQSLLKEQNELTEERARLGIAGTQFKMRARFPKLSFPHFGTSSSEGFAWFAGIGRQPGLRRPKSLNRLVRFEEKKWIKLDRTLQQLTARRKAHEEEYALLQTKGGQLDWEEFQLALATGEFQTLLPERLAAEVKAGEPNREALIQKEQAFEQAKKQFIDRYGIRAFNALSIAADNGLDVSLIHDPSQLEKTLGELQGQKRSLSEEWLLQKEKVNAVAKALGLESAARSAGVPDPESQGDAGKEARILKKRMKYLEREIRRRLDQIQDWEIENENRMHRLDQLLHPKTERSTAQKVAGRIASPASGFYKLTKIFFFGLENRDQKLNQEAREKIRAGEGVQSSEELRAIRELGEEIELQSILIQGRAREVGEMKTDLDRLRKKSGKFPDFEYQSMLVDRFPTALEHSVTSANALFEGEDSQAIFKERYDREHQTLEAIETRLNQTDQKIIPVTEALATLKQEAAEEAARAAELQQGIHSDISHVEAIARGKAQPKVSVPSPTQATEAITDDERPGFETELVRMRTEIERDRKALQEEKEGLEKKLFEWYKSDSVSRGRIQTVFSEEGKEVLARSAEVSTRQNELRTLLLEAAGEEHAQAKLVQAFLDQKLETLEKRREGLKRPNADFEGAINQEIGKTTELKNQTSALINYLDSSFKE